MFCTRCGSELRDHDRFCSQCGVNVQSPYSQPYSPRPVRQLARTMYDKKIAGVCGGFARYFDCDVTFMRVIWLLLTIGTAGFPGIIGYIVAWIAMPKDYGQAVASTVPVNVGTQL
ncbi:MAG TPA: PspC domain-containing protein [Bryobacteraceae bacterium]